MGWLGLWPGLLDQESRRSIQVFLARASMLATLALIPWFGGTWTLVQSAGVLSLNCALFAMVLVTFASVRREPMAHGPLNGWDTALAFLAISRLADFCVGMNG